MTTSDPVLVLLGEHRSIVTLLEEKGELSAAIGLRRDATKILILSGASFFEHRITDAIQQMANGTGDDRVAVLVRNKALKRQYHTMFDWDKRKLGAFRTMFGDSFGDIIKSRQKEGTFADSIGSFLKLGAERNRIVHRNFATYSVDGTLEEWKDAYESACVFVEFIETALAPIASASL